MQIMPIRDMKDTARTTELCERSKEPVFVTKNGYGKLVIMSMETYEEKILLAELMQAKLQAYNREVSDGKETISRLREKYGSK